MLQSKSSHGRDVALHGTANVQPGQSCDCHMLTLCLEANFGILATR